MALGKGIGVGLIIIGLVVALLIGAVMLLLGINTQTYIYIALIVALILGLGSILLGTLLFLVSMFSDNKNVGRY